MRAEWWLLDPNPDVVVCDACDGSGHQWVHIPYAEDPDYMHETTDPCRHCKGTGMIICEIAEEDWWEGNAP